MRLIPHKRWGEKHVNALKGPINNPKNEQIEGSLGKTLKENFKSYLVIF